MKPIRTALCDHLEVNGWDVVRVKHNDLDWWADEIWELASRWTPQGTPAFLTFLVDPQWEGPRPKSSAVWAIGACTRAPTDRHEAQAAGLIYAKPSKADFESLLDTLELLRRARQPL